jgi:glycine/D-amino acid oxidase-like deaminating enzyme
MRTKTTVIVGGRVNGLSIAYWHGWMKENHQREVIVLEARNQCFQGASRYNSGSFGYLNSFGCFGLIRAPGLVWAPRHGVRERYGSL